MDVLESIIDKISIYLGNGRRNVAQGFQDMTLEKYIRLIAVVGAYLLLRPYLIKVGEKIQEQQHEKEFHKTQREKEASEATEATEAKISANALRGEVPAAEDSESEEEDADASVESTNWGKKARKRQRQLVKKLLEADQKRLAEQDEEESDKEIEKFLMETYGPGSLKEE